jgi:hypothetical protein
MKLITIFKDILEIFNMKKKDNPALFCEIQKVIANAFNLPRAEDCFDDIYSYVVSIDNENNEIVSGYRHILCKNAHNEKSFNLNTFKYYEFSSDFSQNYADYTLELGRSFVNPDAKRKIWDNKNWKFYIDNGQTELSTIYEKDAEGNYTKCVKAMVCSTGGHTPQSGTFYLKSRWRWRALFNNCYGQYAVHITGNILFHSVPYTKNGDPGSLEYWEYDKLGTAASLGCVRLKVSDVLWIYNNCPKGTMVRFYTDSNPGPLGKPSAQKISSNETCRGWDPTDPASNNPWKNYKETPTLQTNTTKNANTTETNKNTTITNSTSTANTITNTTNTNTTHSNTTTNATTNTTNTNTTATNIIKNEVKEKNIIDE